MSLNFSSQIAGLPPALFRAEIRPAGEIIYHPLAAVDMASRELKFHPNGGCEGWVMAEGDCAADFRFQLPFPVEEAIFRPSLRQQTVLQLQKNTVELTLIPGQYGMLEINLHSNRSPGCCIAVFFDAPLPPPTGRTPLFIPAGFHLPGELHCCPGEYLHLLPGIHEIEGGRILPQSGDSIYLEPGAIIRAGVAAEECRDLAISGHGIFDGSFMPRTVEENWQGRADDSFIHFYKGENILLQGALFYNPPYWIIVPEGTRRCTIRDCKTIAWTCNSDAVQPRSCHNLQVTHCFFKCDDDGVAVKTRSSLGKDSRNLEFREIIFCNEAASCMEIGHSSQGDLLENVLFRDIECIRSFWGYCHIFLVDHSIIRNIKYENIFIENNLRRIPEISFSIAASEYASDGEFGRIDGITISNLHVEDQFRGIFLRGADASHGITGLRIKEIVVHSSESIHTLTSLDGIPIDMRYADSPEYV